MHPLDGGRIPTLVAIHGRKRSGKGTIAEHLVAKHGFQVVKFADPLKDMTAFLLAAAGIDPATAARCIESDLKEVPVAALGGKSTRYVMQVVGTEVRDAIHTAMWSNIAVGRMRVIRAAGGRVALDDLRFAHEQAVLEAEGATLWLVTSDRSEDVAPDAEVPACMREGGPIDLAGAIDGMVGVLLRHCGAPGAAPDEALAVLGGRTAAHCTRAMREVWLPLMLRPWAPSPAVTAGHASEQPLPRGAFSAHLPNDGSIADLHRLVGSALAAGERPAAA